MLALALRFQENHKIIIQGIWFRGNFESLISGIRSEGATHWTAMFGQRLNVDEQFIDRK
jgi:hypothetical protein